MGTKQQGRSRSERGHLSARTPSDLIALVPYLLGYHPIESLVLIMLVGHRVQCCARIDLPDPDGATTRQPTARPAMQPSMTRLVAEARAVVSRQSPEAVLLVVYGADRRRNETVLDRVTDEFERHGITVPQSIHADGTRWWSSSCRGPCCPSSGTPYDPEDSPVAAEAVYLGLQVLADRAAVSGSVTGPRQTELARLRRAIADLTPPGAPALRGGSPSGTQRHAIRIRGPEPAIAADEKSGNDRLGDELIDPQGLVKALIGSALEALDGAEDPGLESVSGSGSGRDGPGSRRTVSEQVRLRLAVLVSSSVQVRDSALAMITTADADRHLSLWLAAVMSAPPEVACAPLVLLGAAAWAAGNGTLQSCCAERALRLDPSYRLAALLLEVAERGLPPSAWTELMPP